MESTTKLTANCLTEQINDIVTTSTTVNDLVDEINTDIDVESKGIYEGLADFFKSIQGIIIVVLILLFLGGVGLFIFLFIYFMRKRRK